MSLVTNYADAPIKEDTAPLQSATDTSAAKAYPQTAPSAGPVVGVPVGFQPVQQQQQQSERQTRPQPVQQQFIQPVAPIQQAHEHPSGYRQSTVHDGGGTDYDDGTDKTAAEKATELWDATSKGVTQMTGVAGEKVTEWSESAKQWFKSS